MFNYLNYAFQIDSVTKETIELISQQQTATQLVIVLVLVLIIGGSVTMFAIKGFFSSLKDLSGKLGKLTDNLENLTEAAQHQTKSTRYMAKQARLQTETLSSFVDKYTIRSQRIDKMIEEINVELDETKTGLAEAKELLNEANIDKIYPMLVELKKSLEKTKKTTDELDEKVLENVKS
jgi:chromosome segregation ATPase